MRQASACPRLWSLVVTLAIDALTATWRKPPRSDAASVSLLR
jgi:hypothetical protein